MSDPRRVSDDLLLQLIRENRHDSEIAVRLGISTGELRERKAALRAKLGDEAYLRALDTSRPGKSLRRRLRWPLVGVGVVAVFGLLLLVANLVVGDDEEIAEPRVSLSPTTAPTARPPAALTIDGAQFDDAGPFLSLSAGKLSAGVATVENRDALSVVHLNGTAFVSPNEFARWSPLAGGRGALRLFATSFGGRAVSIQLNVANSSSRLRALLSDVGPVAEVSSTLETIQPSIFIRAYDDKGRQLRTRVTDDGRLRISQLPLPPDWVVDRGSGVRVDISEAQPYGRVVLLAGVAATTVCDLPGEEFRCAVLWLRAQGVEVPYDGDFRCVTPTVLRYEAEGIRLEFSMQLNAARIGGADCPTGTVAALARIIPDGDWEIRAYTSAGEPLSVGVLQDGTLLVGQFKGDRSCPCLTQP